VDRLTEPSVNLQVIGKQVRPRTRGAGRRRRRRYRTSTYGGTTPLTSSRVHMHARTADRPSPTARAGAITPITGVGLAGRRETPPWVRAIRSPSAAQCMHARETTPHAHGQVLDAASCSERDGLAKTNQDNLIHVAKRS
jgi:hypothetical protein